MCADRSCLRLFEGVDNGRDHGLEVVLKIAFPDGNHLPAEGFEVFYLSPVAGDVAFEFCLPEIGVGSGEFVIAGRTSVPIAAVDKDHNPLRNERDVGTAWDRLVMEAVAF